MADAEGYVPVYLPDRTVVGKAKISEDGQLVEIKIPEGTAMQELMSENLIGLSVVYQGAIPFGTINNVHVDDVGVHAEIHIKEEEKPTDG